jgi:ATP-binding cassette subfamily C protein CydC
MLNKRLLKESSVKRLYIPANIVHSIFYSIFTITKKLVDAIHSYLKNKSCIWVTHRLVCMDKMDEIIVLEKGGIEERGTHNELLH